MTDYTFPEMRNFFTRKVNEKKESIQTETIDYEHVEFMTCWVSISPKPGSLEMDFTIEAILDAQTYLPTQTGRMLTDHEKYKGKGTCTATKSGDSVTVTFEDKN